MVFLKQYFEYYILCFRYINHILDGPQGPIKTNDYKSVISSISRTRIGLDVLCDFLSINMNRTLNELSDGEDIVTFIYSTLTKKVAYYYEISKVSYKIHIMVRY